MTRLTEPAQLPVSDLHDLGFRFVPATRSWLHDGRGLELKPLTGRCWRLARAHDNSLVALFSSLLKTPALRAEQLVLKLKAFLENQPCSRT